MRVLISSLFVIMFISLSACSKSSENNSNVTSNPNRVNWESIPSEYNRRIEDINFSTVGIERIKVNVFGFDKDAEVVYSSDLAANTGVLKLYIVSESGSSGDTRPRMDGKNLELSSSGRYECKIRTHNGNVVEVKGACYVRLQLILPVGSEVEVYNVEKLISRRFIPIDSDTFLKNYDRAVWEEQKFAAIEDYIESYSGISRSPSLSSQQLGYVVRGVMMSQSKFKVLARLHAYVFDRANLAKMIDDQFSYFDRPEARRIVGL